MPSAVAACARSRRRAAGRSRRPPLRRPRRSAKRPVCGKAMRNSARVCASRSSTAELAPSNSRLSTSARECSCPPAGSSAALRARLADLGAHERLDRVARRQSCRSRAHADRAHRRRGELDRVAVDAASALPGDAVVGADEARDERRLAARSRAPAACRPARSGRAFITADMIGQHQRLGLVVRDVDEGRAEIRLQLLQLDLHVLAQLQVERAQRLVEQQQRRLEHQAARDRDALLLAAGELIDALVLRRRAGRRASSIASTRRAISRSRHAAAREPVADVLADASSSETARGAGTPC